MSCRFIYSRKIPEPHFRRPIPGDGEALVDEYNAELARLEEHGQNTWFTAPWLYAEYAFSAVALCRVIFTLSLQHHRCYL